MMMFNMKIVVQNLCTIGNRNPIGMHRALRKDSDNNNNETYMMIKGGQEIHS